MGDMADDFNDYIMDMIELEDDLSYNLDYQGLYDNGFIDELGFATQLRTSTNVLPFLVRIAKRTSCPICGGKTHRVNGKFGPFLGCDKFPKCKGSISLKE